MTASNLLREATATAHKAAEQHLNAASILDGSLSLAGFSAMIQLHYVVWSTVTQWWPPETKGKALLTHMSAALLKDLNRLGLTVPSAKQLLLDKEDGPTRYGVLYVLRGSTLGGTMINRKLKACSGLAGLTAFHFHEACEALPGKEWPAFLREMNEAVLTPAEQQRAVAGAGAVFGLYLSS